MDVDEVLQVSLSSVNAMWLMVEDFSYWGLQGLRFRILRFAFCVGMELR